MCLCQDPRRQVDTKNLVATDWRKNETSGLLERDLTYDRFQDFVITSATIKVTQKHVSNTPNHLPFQPTYLFVADTTAVEQARYGLWCGPEDN